MLLAYMILNIESVSTGVILSSRIKKKNSTSTCITFYSGHFFDGVKGELFDIFGEIFILNFGNIRVKGR